MQLFQTAVWCSEEDLQDHDLNQRRIQALLPQEQTQALELKFLTQLKEEQSLNIYTEQMTTEVSYWWSARKSTIERTSTLSQADIYSFCLHFWFLKPPPSHLPWMSTDRHCQKPLFKESLSWCTNPPGRRRGCSSSKVIWTTTTMSQYGTQSTHN